MSPPLAKVLDYLAHCFQSGYQFRTIGVHRLALSMTLPPVAGVVVGQHPLVSRLMKGVYVSRPPVPRYARTWDVSVVLNYLRSLPLPLSWHDLTLKLVVLLALATHRRCSDLHRLDIQYINFSATSVKCGLTGLSKTQKPGDPAREIVLPYYSNELLCSNRCLQEYIVFSAVHRPVTVTALFLSLRRPYHAVAKSTLSRWITKVLSLAGIDTSIFRAHSTRGASASAAVTSGVPVRDVLRHADWRSERTFRQFYYRSVAESDSS